MKKFDIAKGEIYSLLTSNQINELNEIAVIKDFGKEQIIYDQKEEAKNLFILLEGRVSLRIPSNKDKITGNFSLEIENILHQGELFGTNLLFDIKNYMTRATALKPSKIMILDARKFLEIIRENKSGFVVLSYLAKVYFQRYITAMKELEECLNQYNAI